MLTPGGTVVVLEANARNPIVALQARLVRAEAVLRRFGPDSVLAALSGLPLRAPRVEMVSGCRSAVCSSINTSAGPDSAGGRPPSPTRK